MREKPLSLRYLIIRSLRHYWRTGLVVAVGIAVATATITGSLLVGDSVKGSLRDMALARLGHIDHIITAPLPFRAALADDLRHHPRLSRSVERISPLLLMQGATVNADSEAMVPNVSVIGVDDTFAGFYRPSSVSPLSSLRERRVALNQTLAKALGVRAGDALLLNVDRPSAVAADSLFAHHKREETLRTLRLEVGAILPDTGAGAFRLDAGAMPPRNLFIAREWLAEQVDQAGRANALALQWRPGGATLGEVALRAALPTAVTLEDHGLQILARSQQGYLSLQSEGVVLREAQVRAVAAAARECGARAALTSVTLATTIRRVLGGKELAYAIVGGLESDADHGRLWPLEIHSAQGSPVPQPIRSSSPAAEPAASSQDPGGQGALSAPFRFLAGDGKPLDRHGIWLNRWAAEDLGAKPGETLELATLIPSWDGIYRTARRALTLRGIVDLAGPGADPGLVPALKGITDAERVDAWDAPFPLEMSRITPRDEAYWDRYRAAPKAFVSLECARDLWLQAAPAGAADWVTSVRLLPGPGSDLGGLQVALARAIVGHLTPEDGGFQSRPVRRMVLEASSGTTDFGQLFLAMSFFLILSAAALAGMTMRLLAERRANETGLLLACGFTERAAVRAVLGEAAVLTLIGSLVGCPLGVAYAGAILRLLATRWVGAVGTTALWLHVTPASLGIGLFSGLAIGLISVWWGARSLRGRPVLELLAGWRALGVLLGEKPARWVRPAFWGSLTLAAALVLAALGKGVSAPGAFFGSGALFLAAGLLGGQLLLVRALAVRGEIPSLPRLALRSAAANRGRSLLVVGLLACATFLIVAVAANRRDFSNADTRARESGTGGFALQVVSALPVRYDFGTPEGRAKLGFPLEDEALFQGVDVVPFLMSGGEDVSCLNLARPTVPRILGVGPKMVERGGFAVQSPGRPAEPWRSLEGAPSGWTFPAFGDADTVMWNLHSGAGGTYELPSPQGPMRAVRFAGILPGSLFGSEILVSEASFRAVYPSISAPRYFLVAVPPGKEDAVARSLRRNLADQGADVHTTREILNAYHRVTNTYLSTFLALGGLGILLGTFGLVSVLLRGALERRGEFALMLATGFRRGDLARLLLLENAGLLIAGLFCGLVSALVAVAPQLLSVEARVPWGTVAAVLAGMLAVGLLSCAVAARLAVRSQLVRALREE